MYQKTYMDYTFKMKYKSSTGIASWNLQTGWIKIIRILREDTKIEQKGRWILSLGLKDS